MRLTAVPSAADAGIHRKILGLGVTTLITSNEEADDFMKIVKSLKEYGSLMKVVNKITENKVKEKGDFLSVLLGTLGASYLGNMLTGKRVKTIIPGREVMRGGKGTTRAGKDF